jgi:hypothetical protein
MISVLVAGSLPLEHAQYAKFAEFTAALGRFLVSDHRLLVGGTDLPTADHHFVLGAFDRFENPIDGERVKIDVTLYKTEGDRSTPESEAYRKIKAHEGKATKVIPFPSGRGYEPALDKAVEDCDVIILIGGNRNSRHIIDHAIREQKPVLGFSAFDGIGEVAHNELQRVYELFGISSQTASFLDKDTLEPKDEQHLRALVAMVHERNPWSTKRNSRLLFVCTLGLIALVLGWALIFMQAHDKTLMLLGRHYHWLFPLSLSAGFVGGLWRFLSDTGSPRYVSAKRAIELSAGGITSGFAVATFSSLLLFTLYKGPPVPDENISFIGVFLITSLASLVIGAGGLSALELLEKVLHKTPH